jgi:O-antigen ligase
MRPRSVNDVLNGLVVLLAFSIPLYRAWVSLAAILILLLWFFQDRLGNRTACLRQHRLTIAILVFLALNLLSLLWSEDPAGGFTYWRKYLYLLLVPAIASSLKPETGGRALVAFVAATVLAVLMMPVVIIGDIHVRHIHPGNPATTMSHLDFSMVLAIAALFVLVHLAHASMTRGHRAWWIAALVVILAGLLVNIGRSGQLAFAVTLGVLVPFLLRKRPWGQRAAALAGVGCLLVIAYAAVPRFHERVDSGLGEIRAAVVEERIVGNQGKRVAGMIVGLDMIKSSPILGTGIGGNMPEFRRRLESDYPQFKSAVGWFPHFHNQYMQVATELGLLGLASLLWVFAALLAGRRRNPELISAALALGCAYLVGFLGDPFLHKQMTVVLFALSAGVISADDEVFAKGEPTVDGPAV